MSSDDSMAGSGPAARVTLKSTPPSMTLLLVAVLLPGELSNDDARIPVARYSVNGRGVG